MQSETPFESLLVSSRKCDLIAHMREHPEAFEEALSLALADRPPYSWRAAWLLWSCVKKNDPRLRRRYGDIVRAAAAARDNLKRELFKILQMLEPAEAHESELFDACVSAWETLNSQPSVRMNALKLLLMTAKRYPELLREISILTRREYLETLSPGANKSATRMVRSALKRGRSGKEELE